MAHFGADARRPSRHGRGDRWRTCLCRGRIADAGRWRAHRSADRVHALIKDDGKASASAYFPGLVSVAMADLTASFGVRTLGEWSTEKKRGLPSESS